MSEQKSKRPPASTKRIAVWFGGVMIFVLGGYWIKAGLDASASEAISQWVYFGGAAIILGLGVMLYSRFGLR
jgi:hypothetical protein